MKKKNSLNHAPHINKPYLGPHPTQSKPHSHLNLVSNHLNHLSLNKPNKPKPNPFSSKWPSTPSSSSTLPPISATNHTTRHLRPPRLSPDIFTELDISPDQSCYYRRRSSIQFFVSSRPKSTRRRRQISLSPTSTRLATVVDHRSAHRHIVSPSPIDRIDASSTIEALSKLC